MATSTRTTSLALGPAAVAMVLGGAAAGWFVFGAAEAARRPLGWAIACAIVAALLAPLVDTLDRWLPRVLAVLGVFVLVGAAIGGLTFGVLRDLDDQVSRLKESAPEAAAELADSGGLLGDLATDINLEQRVDDLIAELEKPSSGVAARAASSAGAWFVCFVLTAFFLSWGPRLGTAALKQISDEDRRARTGRIGRAAAGRGRRYLLGSHGLAILSGLVAWGACDLEGVPAPLALGVAVAAGSIIPGVGVVVGGLPAILLEIGLGTRGGGVRLALVFLALQAVHAVALRRVVSRRSLVVGPAVIIIALVLGYDIYGVGGAYYGAALAVFGVAALDALGRDGDREAGVRPSS